MEILFFSYTERTQKWYHEKNGSIYLHVVKFDDKKGIYVCNQWYSSISIKGNHDSVFENKNDLQTKQYDYSIAFSKKINGEHLYLIINSNWLYHNHYVGFSLHTLGNDIYNKYNLYLGLSIEMKNGPFQL